MQRLARSLCRIARPVSSSSASKLVARPFPKVSRCFSSLSSSFRVSQKSSNSSLILLGAAAAASVALISSSRAHNESSGAARCRKFEEMFFRFASREIHGVKYMTKEDFVASLLPFELSKKAKKAAEKKDGKKKGAAQSFLFHLADSDGEGLLSLDEYIFFLTLLTTPTRHFSVAFRMFDLDNSGEIEEPEFQVMVNFITQQKPSLTALQQKRSPLKVHLFGADGKRKLKLEQFSSFLGQLKESVLKMEFEALDSEGAGSIPASQFARALVAFASTAALPDYQKRVSDIKADPVSLEQYLAFNKLLEHLSEFETAAELVSVSGGAFNSAAFLQTARNVCGAELDSNTVSIIFGVFDRDGDRRLDPAEFIELLKARKNREIASPGFMPFVECVRHS